VVFDSRFLILERLFSSLEHCKACSNLSKASYTEGNLNYSFHKKEREEETEAYDKCVGIPKLSLKLKYSQLRLSYTCLSCSNRAICSRKELMGLRDDQVILNHTLKKCLAESFKIQRESKTVIKGMANDFPDLITCI
jgi:hypothetical protein